MKDENTSRVFKTIQIRLKLSTFMFYSLVLVKKKERETTDTKVWRGANTSHVGGGVSSLGKWEQQNVWKKGSDTAQ